MITLPAQGHPDHTVACLEMPELVRLMDTLAQSALPPREFDPARADQYDAPGETVVPAGLDFAWRIPFVALDATVGHRRWSIESVVEGLSLAVRILDPAGVGYSLTGARYQALAKRDARVPSRGVIAGVCRRHGTTQHHLRVAALEAVRREGSGAPRVQVDEDLLASLPRSTLARRERFTEESLLRGLALVIAELDSIEGPLPPPTRSWTVVARKDPRVPLPETVRRRAKKWGIPPDELWRRAQTLVRLRAHSPAEVVGRRGGEAAGAAPVEPPTSARCGAGRVL